MKCKLPRARFFHSPWRFLNFNYLQYVQRKNLMYQLQINYSVFNPIQKSLKENNVIIVNSFKYNVDIWPVNFPSSACEVRSYNDYLLGLGPNTNTLFSKAQILFSLFFCLRIFVSYKYFKQYSFLRRKKTVFFATFYCLYCICCCKNVFVFFSKTNTV